MGNSKFGPQEFTGHGECRYYRAPEKILHLSYGPAVDIWSLGCNVFEMATGEILFKGDNKPDQLVRIMEIFGVPPKEMIERSNVAYRYFNSRGEPLYCRNQKNIDYKQDKVGVLQASGSKRKLPGRRNFKAMMHDYDPAVVDFIQACLKWNPEERLTSQEALNHHWLLGDSLIDYGDDRPSLAASSSVSLSSYASLRRGLSQLPSLGSLRRPPLSDEILPALHLKWMYVNSLHLQD